MSDSTHSGDLLIAPVPRITIQAFCETPDVAASIQAAADDRRMHKAHVKVQMGGAPAAVEAYRQAPTPNVIVLESIGDRAALLGHLDSLSEVCDGGTKVVVIGHVNEVVLYRELVRRGISEYIIAPVAVLDVVKAISDLFCAPGAEPVGRTIAVVGAKGGVGSSTVAHNLGWATARQLSLSTVVADLDIAFGTAGLDFNQDPPQGIAEAIFAPARLDRTTDLVETALDGLLDILRASVPCIILDVPHLWTAWVRRTLIGADEIAIVAAPELASLRNTKNLFDSLRQARPNDRKPKIVLNQVGLPKRPEISAADFAKALGTEIFSSLPFDAQLFGTAANNGQMIAEVQASGKIADAFAELAAAITGRAEPRRSKTNLLEPILARLGRRKAS